MFVPMLTCRSFPLPPCATADDLPSDMSWCKRRRLGGAEACYSLKQLIDGEQKWRHVMRSLYTDKTWGKINWLLSFLIGASWNYILWRYLIGERAVCFTARLSFRVTYILLLTVASYISARDDVVKLPTISSWKLQYSAVSRLYHCIRQRWTQKYVQLLHYQGCLTLARRKVWVKAIHIAWIAN